MSQIHIATQNQTKPHAKTRVYFAAHPGDFEKYFDTLCDDFFIQLDCAMYYYKPEQSVDDKAREFDLSQMQLFVVVVTNKFLCGGSKAYDVDFKYAREKHIPVVPVICEPGAGAQFEKQFKSIQYIDRAESAYKNKLEKFLREKTKTQNLSKIQSVFEGHAFLSYRKNDRIFADRVIKTLHKNEVNPRLSIWYDEFLVPGENFNENISGAIEKSDIFIMVITPEVLQCPNYIKSNEYPVALKLGKPIIPIEVIKTNRAELEKLYPGLPPCININDTAKLRDIIDKHLGKTEKTELDANGYYYLGEAYLRGFGVEIDVETAKKMLVAAADMNHLNSILMLAKMYASGDGVNVDNLQSLEWRKKAVEVCEKQYKTTEGTKVRTRYYDHLRSLAQCYKRCNMTDDAIKTLDVAISIAEKYKEGKDVRWKIQLYTKKMEIFVDGDRLDEGLQVYKGFIKELESIAARDKTFKPELCAAYDNAQNMYTKLGKKEEVIAIANKSLKVIEKGSRSYGKPTKVHRALAYNNQGIAYWRAEEYELAEEALKKSIAVYDNIKSLSKNLDIRNMAVGYSNIAGMYYDWGKLDLAIENYIQAIKYFDRLPENAESLSYKYSSSVYICKLYLKKQEFEQAEKYAIFADEYFKKINKAFPEESKKYSGGWHKYVKDTHAEFIKSKEPQPPSQNKIVPEQQKPQPPSQNKIVPEQQKPEPLSQNETVHEQQKPKQRITLSGCCKFILKCIFKLVVYPIIFIVAVLVAIIEIIKEKK